MLEKEIFNEMPIIVFGKEIDDEDVKEILTIFEKWCTEELNKRLAKKGKLFEFSFCNIDNSATIGFGNHKTKKYVDILEGYCGDYFKQQRIHKFYEKIVVGALEIADRIVAENKLTKAIKPTGGCASWYVVSR